MPDEKGQNVGGWSESVPHSVWLSRVNFKAQFPAQVKSRVAIAFRQQQQQQWQEQQVNAFKSYVCFALLCFLSFFRHALFYAASSFILFPPLCCPISTPDVSISWPFYGPETDVAPPPINWTLPFCSPCFRLEPLATHIRFDLFNLAKIQVNS